LVIMVIGWAVVVICKEIDSDTGNLMALKNLERWKEPEKKSTTPP